MNTIKVCSVVVRYMKDLYSSTISFESLFRITTGHVATIVNAMVLHDDDACRALYRNVHQIISDMANMTESREKYDDLSVFGAIYGDVMPLAEAINRDCPSEGKLALRLAYILKDLFDAWATYCNGGSCDRAISTLVQVMMKTCAWHVERASAKVGSPSPFDDNQSFVLIDDDYEWLEIFDSHVGEFMKRLADLRHSLIPVTTET